MKNIIDFINEAKYTLPDIFSNKTISAYNPDICKKVKRDTVQYISNYSKDGITYRSYSLPTKRFNSEHYYDIYKPFNVTCKKLKEMWTKSKNPDQYNDRTLYDEADLLYLDNKDFSKGVVFRDDEAKFTIIPYTVGDKIAGIFIIDFNSKRCTKIEENDRQSFINLDDFKKTFKMLDKNWIVSSDYDKYNDYPWERFVEPVEFALQKQLK